VLTDSSPAIELRAVCEAANGGLEGVLVGPQYETGVHHLDTGAPRQRSVSHAEAEAIDEQEDRGLLPHGLSASLLGEINHQLNSLRGQSEARLHIDDEALLHKLPLFSEISLAVMQHLIGRLQTLIRESSETIISQGELGPLPDELCAFPVRNRENSAISTP
jgi:hypothetical protein